MTKLLAGTVLRMVVGPLIIALAHFGERAAISTAGILVICPEWPKPPKHSRNVALTGGLKWSEITSFGLGTEAGATK